MATAIVPGIYDPSLADATLEVSTEAAYDMVKRIARTEGVLLGTSAGAALVASLKVAQQLSAKEHESATSVTVLPDSADKYLSEKFWSE